MVWMCWVWCAGKLQRGKRWWTPSLLKLVRMHTWQGALLLWQMSGQMKIPRTSCRRHVANALLQCVEFLRRHQQLALQVLRFVVLEWRGVEPSRGKGTTSGHGWPLSSPQ